MGGAGAEPLHPAGMGDHLDLDTLKVADEVLYILSDKRHLLALVEVDDDLRRRHIAVTLPRSSALAGPRER